MKMLEFVERELQKGKTYEEVKQLVEVTIFVSQ
jgi:hypothetical protein